MQKVACLLFSGLLMCRASATDSMPHELVREWRNSSSETNYDEIAIAPNGTGYLDGSFQGDGKFYETKVEYNPSKNLLTITAQRQGAHPDEPKYVSEFEYHPDKKTLTKMQGTWGGTAPFARPPEKSILPEFTLSPDRRYGVTVPAYYFDDPNDVSNNLVEVKTGRVLTPIRAQVGYDRRLNFLEVGPTRWSNDSSILLWEVNGKWMDTALVLIKIKNGEAAWQLDILKTAQKAILERTKKASPKSYLAVKGDGSGYGSAYPDGFTVPVSISGELDFPITVHADLTANPKGIENYPHNLDSQLDGIVDANGKFTVTHFQLTASKRGE